MDTIQRWIDGKIDFQGQRLADRLMQEGLVAGAAVGFLLGYLTQNMQLCMLTFGASIFIVALLTIPAWPFYNKYKVEWLPNTTSSPTQGVTSNTTHADKPVAAAKKSKNVKTSITTKVS
ncbi:related to SPC1 - signal peptidase 10.8 kDa subunit [Melanopsichium pennsylvanicum]|uniref:Signal peptidase complex subunit 1 n=1 Tax=Melanopsichium pennsylvanicum TaxID=63383 RepID=A0AAJ5C3Z8_9BASI|nr:related to SPC1 - signal peptidase 10.8 kDa subunit [Melanopsichium pennsylvanicum]